MSHLHWHGGFALDDFGTGYSSLAYFRNLPVDILKIDQSFVRDMLDDPNDLEIVESVVRLAGAFGRTVIAEGVETLEHGAALLGIGCRLCQGYGIARPMPARQLLAWVEQWRRQEVWKDLDKRYDAAHEVSLLVASNSHRKWFDCLIENLDNPGSQTKVELDPRHCRFGRWYHGSGVIRYGDFAEFPEIVRAHDHIHALAGELLRLADSGHGDMVKQRLHELYAGRDGLVQRINALVEKVPRPAA